MSKFTKYAWLVLAVNILVILWGVYVRASGSGAGCGSHWPLCNGVVIPLSTQTETIVEFTHRLSSGLALILVVGLFIFAWRNYSSGNLVRRGASWAMILIIIESLIGAGLVLLELVGSNESVRRVIFISLHLVNTFLLLASITLTAWWSQNDKPLQFTGNQLVYFVLGLGFFSVLLLGISGAITALGDTLFPVETLTQGIQQDFSATAHFLVRLRVWHPIIAILTGLYLCFVSLLIAAFVSDRTVKILAWVLVGLFLTQLTVGLINLFLLAPIPVQMIHLLLADLVWVVLVVFSSSILLKPKFNLG